MRNNKFNDYKRKGRLKPPFSLMIFFIQLFYLLLFLLIFLDFFCHLLNYQLLFYIHLLCLLILVLCILNLFSLLLFFLFTFQGTFDQNLSKLVYWTLYIG